MKFFIFSAFLTVLPFAKSETCADGSQCPGGESCCPSSQGERCCSALGGMCCPNGYCCPPGLYCIPIVHICVPVMFFSTGQGKKTVSPRIKLENPKVSQCLAGTTECGTSPNGDECCPLPNAVCCSDGKHCCPSGYTCDLSAGTCERSPVHHLQNMKVLRKAVQKVVCPDGSLCHENGTCCLITDDAYGCCGHPNAICCSDHIHCCPSGSKCNAAKGVCESGKYFTSWLRKTPNVKANVPLV